VSRLTAGSQAEGGSTRAAAGSVDFARSWQQRLVESHAPTRVAVTLESRRTTTSREVEAAFARCVTRRGFGAPAGCFEQCSHCKEADDGVRSVTTKCRQRLGRVWSEIRWCLGTAPYQRRVKGVSPSRFSFRGDAEQVLWLKWQCAS